MMRDDMPELPNEMRALLRAEQPVPPLPEDAIARIRARLHASIEAAPLPPSTPESARSTQPTPSAIPARLHGASLAIGAIVGAIAGAAAMWALIPNEVPISQSRDEAPPIAVPDRELETPDHSSSALAEGDETNAAIENEARPSDERALPAETLRRNTRSTHAAQVESPPREASFADERRILDAARTAISSGHVEEGLDALRRHLRDHESGALAEERDALEIRALLELNRIGEARMYAENFRVSYPGSVFWPSIEARLARAASHTSEEDVSTLSRP